MRFVFDATFIDFVPAHDTAPHDVHLVLSEQLQQAPCVLPTGLAPLRCGGGGAHVIGGVSSFGYSGTIAHLMVRLQMIDDETHTPSCCGRCTGGTQSAVLCRHMFGWQQAFHPLAQSCDRSFSTVITLRSPVTGALHELVADHVVQGSVTFPGAAYLETARAACATAGDQDEFTLANVFVVKPLVLLASSQQCLVCSLNLIDGSFEVNTTLDEAGESTTHSKGEFTMHAANWQLRAVYTTRSNVPLVSNVMSQYDCFEADGLSYGPAFRLFLHAWSTSAAVSAMGVIARPDVANDRLVHPAVLDCSQHVTALLPATDTDALFPFAYGQVSMRPTESLLWVAVTGSTASSEVTVTSCSGDLKLRSIHS